jgi:hypothetical protein
LIVDREPPGGYRRRGITATLRVEFTRDAGLNLIVPKELSETFWIRGGVGTGKGRYSNFRKFSTSARIVP